MFSLPSPKGPFAVGATTFTVPVNPVINVGRAKLKRRNNFANQDLEPALSLEEVAFTAFYPADTSRGGSLRKGIDWLLRPIPESVRGFVHFAGLNGVSSWILWPVASLFGRLLKIPVYPNAPLLHPASIDLPISDSKPHSPPQWPLVIFSHGLGGSRSAYSQICTEVASSGRVVLVMEHRDGTGHVCMPCSYGPQGEKLEPKPKLYIQPDEVVWEDGESVPSSELAIRFRIDQLTFRRHEIYTAYTAFQSLVEDEHYSGDDKYHLEPIDGGSIDRESWSNKLGGFAPVQCREVTLMGHSFGGATIFSILSSPAPSSNFSRISVSKALALDPWLEPIPSPGPVPYPDVITQAASPPPSQGSSSSESLLGDSHNFDSTTNVDHDGHKHSIPSMLVINSEGFTLWKDHFERLQKVVEAWEPSGKGSILTIVRSRHVSFSDFPILPVVRRSSTMKTLDVIKMLSLAYLDEQIDQRLRDIRTRAMEIETILVKGKPKRKIVGELGDVVVH